MYLLRGPQLSLQGHWEKCLPWGVEPFLAQTPHVLFRLHPTPCGYPLTPRVFSTCNLMEQQGGSQGQQPGYPEVLTLFDSPYSFLNLEIVIEFCYVCASLG